ncbi:CRISPR-associated helicase Cas3' [Marinicrinis sediminis]|uniref:CRISPR-associated helicase Cas3 n=1 Tax=Marinicrinis sediminis TaxID=1652465 RepID=A0ABW5RDE4_9BACL
MYIAHIRKQDQENQSVETHLDEVKELSEQFGQKIGVKYLAGLAGLLHDLGKNTEAFKQYIKAVVENPVEAPRKGSVDHSTAGGKLLYELYYREEATLYEKLAVEWTAMCIISHHQGLRDFLTPQLTSTFLERVSHKELPEFNQARETFLNQQMTVEQLTDYFHQAVEEIKTIIGLMKENTLHPISLSLVIKYIFSCLIDADRTNTRKFEEGNSQGTRFQSKPYFQDRYEALLETVTAYQNGEDSDHPINRLRNEMSMQCDQFASRQPSGIYTLSIPTGGGKTLASMRYALKHAVTYNKERIIYIVPYTTIIEQNAEEAKRVLRDNANILEHHSNIIEQEPADLSGEDIAAYQSLHLAKDNWESPIIFTTMVQFLNTLYGKGTRNVRRLHHLSNAILVFDEVQAVPVKCISMFNEALNFLHTICHSTIVLCTATQPALDFVEHDLKIAADAEIIPNLDKVSASFKRVRVEDRTRPSGYNVSELNVCIQTELDNVRSVLVILNTKRAARKLYEALQQNEKDDDSPEKGYRLFHLSTNMCPAHRKDVLRKLKQSLSDGERVVCVSTQLIEAGVDISFECVFRSLAGLDSIAQAAGRCNRHGKDPIRNVYIINVNEEDITNLKTIQAGSDITKRVLDEYKKDPDSLGHDLLSPQVMRMYFCYYFHRMKIDMHYAIPVLENHMIDLLGRNSRYTSAFKNAHAEHLPILSSQSFATAEKYFNVIDQPTTSVLVPYNAEANELLVELNGDMNTDRLGQILKQAQQYTINIYKHEMDKLEKSDDLYVLLHGSVYALRETAYDSEIGLDLESGNGWSVEIQ